MIRKAFLAAAIAAPLAAHAQEALRPAVGKPLESARAYLARRNCGRAMAEVRAAQGVGGLTANETFVTEQMLGAVAQSCGDTATASRTYQQLLASGRLSAAEQQKLMLAEVSIAYSERVYPNVVYWSERYLKSGGTDPNVRTFLIQGYYLQAKYAEAGQLQAQQIAAEQHLRQRPTENQLELLYNCQLHTNDKPGAQRTMYQLVYYYPKPDYWANVIDSVRSEPSFNDRLMLDIYRLEMAVGLLKSANDYMDMTELALQAPVPGEAKSIIDQAYAAGVLGSGTEAPRQQRLRDLVSRTYAADLKALPAQVKDAEGDRDGNRLVGAGWEYVSYGQYAQGIALMEDGIRRDSLKHPDDDKLHLGLAYLRAGQQPRAMAELRTVDGTEGAGAIARLWMLYTSQHKVQSASLPR